MHIYKGAQSGERIHDNHRKRRRWILRSLSSRTTRLPHTSKNPRPSTRKNKGSNTTIHRNNRNSQSRDPKNNSKNLRIPLNIPEKLLQRQTSIKSNLPQKTPPNLLPTMYRHNSHPPILPLQHQMTTPLPNRNKTKLHQRPHNTTPTHRMNLTFHTLLLTRLCNKCYA